MTTQPNDENQELAAMDFVYSGRRWSSNGKLLITLYPIVDGVLQKERVFEYDRKAHRVVGGIYTGAKFNDGSMLGFTSALQYVGRWENQADLLEWQAKDEHAETRSKARKLEADDKKISEIERILLPLRIQYESMRKRRDMAGMEALRLALNNALYSAPRESELGK